MSDADSTRCRYIYRVQLAYAALARCWAGALQTVIHSVWGGRRHRDEQVGGEQLRRHVRDGAVRVRGEARAHIQVAREAKICAARRQRRSPWSTSEGVHGAAQVRPRLAGCAAGLAAYVNEDVAAAG